MPVQLPLIPSVPFYRVGTVLAGVQYILDLRWNGRESSWFMDVLDEEETPIRSGLRIVLGALLGARSANPDFPAGAFIVSDLSGQGLDAGIDDIGENQRVQVYFYTNAEVAAVAG